MNRPEDLSELVQDLRAEQRRCWINGNRRLAEEYFRLQPQLRNDKEASLDFLYGEYCLREELGEAVDPLDYLRRFPEFEREMKMLFEVHQAMDSNMLQATAASPAPAGPARENLNCPVCHNPVEIDLEDRDQDFVCPTCGNSFRLDTERLQTWSPDSLPTLGKFKLVEVVGRGAFGTVYRGRDMELHRTVAVKVPRSGQLATPEDEDRFVREARNVAQLQHPGIVPVFEVGRSGTFPFLVSEFVEGVTLADVMTVRRLGFREAATLLAQVAQAVEHAHTRGVIHRDLKPSNIMLTPQGLPRVMDFGLAKRDVGEVTMTTDGAVLGTPAYMSPEQASGHAHHVDGRSDVYSLGVIFYQVLTSELPFRGNQRMILHQVQYEEPRAPRSLNDRIPRDLSTICLKAMAKEPPRRYATAGDMALDLDRYLVGKPILARPVGRVDRAWRWCKRNSVVAGLVASILLLLLLGTAGLAVGLVAVNHLRLDAEANAERAISSAEEAQRNAAARDQLAKKERVQRANAEQVNRFLVGLFQSADPIGLGQWGFRTKIEEPSDLTAVDIVRRGVSQTEALKDQPEVWAAMVDTLGTVLCSLGDFDEAERLLAAALEYRRVHGHDQPLALASTLQNLGQVHFEWSHLEEAEQMMREALQLRQRAAGSDDLLVADSKFALARTIASMPDSKNTRSEEVEQLVRDVVSIRTKRLPGDDRQVAIARAALAAVLFGKGNNLAGALELNQAIQIFEKHEGTKSTSAAVAAVARLDFERVRGNHQEALRISKELVERLEPMLGPDHPLLAMALGNLAGRTLDVGDAEEAERLVRRALDIGRRSPLRRHPLMISGLIQLADRVVGHAVTAQDNDLAREQFNEAENLYMEALKYRDEGQLSNKQQESELINQRLESLNAARKQKFPAGGP